MPTSFSKPFYRPSVPTIRHADWPDREEAEAMIRNLQEPSLAATIDPVRVENAFRIYGFPQLHPDAVSRAQAEAFEARQAISKPFTHTSPADEPKPLDDFTPGLSRRT